MESADLVETLRVFLAGQLQVRLGYLFGSRAQGTAHALSDVDVAVLLDGGLSSRGLAETRLYLTAELMRLLRTDDLDLVVLNHAPFLLRHRVLRQGQLLFAADEAERVRFTAETLERYLDHLYMYGVLDETMFVRLKEGCFGRGQVSPSSAFRKARELPRQGPVNP
jgi:predicted nucleotidyltransferase